MVVIAKIVNFDPIVKSWCSLENGMRVKFKNKSMAEAMQLNILYEFTLFKPKSQPNAQYFMVENCDKV